MPSKADLSGTTLPRRQLGRALREARSALGATLEQVARDTEFSRAMLSRIELGQYERIKIREVEFLCRYYEFPDTRTEYLMAIASESNTKVWWQDYENILGGGFTTYLELESCATDLRFFQPLVVSGLLQTSEYARTIFRAHAPDSSSEEIEKRVELRKRRRSRIMRQRWRVQLEFLIHESVLHTKVGSERGMASQCRWIADLSTHENFAIRVLPFSAGVPTGGVITPFVILGFPDTEPSVVYAEAALGSMTFENAEDVQRSHATYVALRNTALDEQASRNLIRATARRYER